MWRLLHERLAPYLRHGSLYVIDDELFLVADSENDEPVMTLGWWSAFLGAFVDEAIQAECGGLVDRAAATRAVSLPAKQDELKFALVDLVRYLSDREAEQAQVSYDVSDFESKLNQPAKSPATPHRTGGDVECRELVIDVWRKRFGRFWGITDGQLVGLRSRASRVPNRNLVAVDGRWYERLHVHDRTLAEACMELESWVRYYRPELVPSTRNKTAVDSLIERVSDTVAKPPLRHNREFDVVYRGARHELQYRRGDVMLTRGNTLRRPDGRLVYVGVRLNGASRSHWLGHPPLVATTANSLWNSGRSSRTVCMGDARQYHHLYDETISDAEAVTFWLDAAAIVSGGRATHHAFWRREQGGVNPYRYGIPF